MVVQQPRAQCLGVRDDQLIQFGSHTGTLASPGGPITSRTVPRFPVARLSSWWSHNRTLRPGIPLGTERHHPADGARRGGSPDAAWRGQATYRPVPLLAEKKAFKGLDGDDPVGLVGEICVHCYESVRLQASD